MINLRGTTEISEGGGIIQNVYIYTGETIAKKRWNCRGGAQNCMLDGKCLPKYTKKI